MSHSLLFKGIDDADIIARKEGKALLLVGKSGVIAVSDDFESYRTIDNNRAGKWTIKDEDGQAGSVVSYYFPGSSEPTGWVVLEPGAVPTIEGGNLASRLPAYSGAKYMATYRPGTGDNDDWLTTPLLSGNAQTISFMARAESGTPPLLLSNPPPSALGGDSGPAAGE